MPRIPRVTYAVVNLCRVTGGIAVLARSAYRTLYDMDRRGETRLRVAVLDERRPDPTDGLLQDCAGISIRWCAGSRIRFAWAVLASRPDLVIFDHAGPARVTGVLPRCVRPPYCVFVHGVEVAEQVRADYTKALEGARFLIANSHYTKSRAEALGADLPPIQVCWLGIDPVAVRGKVDDLVLAAVGPHALLIVGRMAACQRHKGHDRLIECMPRIVERIPDAQLIIAGGGDDVERLRQKAGASGVGEQILFAGKVSDEVLHALYQRCAVFVMPSTGDGFGFVYLEAMSHAKPCVGLVDGSAAEIIEHGVTGLLVDRNKRPEMADAIATLLADPPRRDRMGKAGFGRLHGMFLQEHFGQRFRGVLRGALR